MALRPQWYLASMGLTNSVQPYCKLATLAMQMTPRMSWTHGFARAEGADWFELAFMLFSRASLRAKASPRAKNSAKDQVALSGAGRWRPMVVLGKLSPLAETDAPMPPWLGSNIEFERLQPAILSVIYHIRMSFRLSSKLNGCAERDRRSVECAIHGRIIESRINKSRSQNIQNIIAGRSTASQLECASIGARDLHITLTLLLHALA